MQVLAEVVVLARFLSEAGYGRLEQEALIACNQVIAAAFDKGRESGVWEIDAQGYEWLAKVVQLHDQQLRTVTMGDLSTASRRLDKFKAQGSSRQA
jgi:hypothetical protein